MVICKKIQLYIYGDKDEINRGYQYLKDGIQSPFHINCCVPQFLKHAVYLFLKKKKNNPSSIMVKDPQTETHVGESHSSHQPTPVC